MTKEIYISSTPHETRLAVVEDDQLAEIYYERENEYTLAGSIYKGKVTRVLPGMQSAFVDIGLERDAFLYVTDFAEEQEDGEEYVSLAPGTRGQARLPNGHANGGRSADAESQATSEDSASRASGERSPAGNQPAREASSASGDEEGQGGRRWRGRRGRRRGRGGPGGQDRSPSNSQPVATEPPSDNHAEPMEFAIESAPSDVEFQMEPHDFTPPSAPPQQQRSHSAPSRSEPVPFVLPGESLSKYRRGDSAAPSAATQQKETPAAAPQPTFKPSTMVTGPLAWDGSGVLPGESLSRHKRSRETSSPTPEAFSSPAAELGLAPDETAVVPAELAPPVHVDETPLPVFEHEEPSLVQHETILEEPSLVQHAIVPEEPSLVQHDSAAAVIAEAAEIEAPEFEPSEASASYRFDPSTPSAYRQSSIAEPPAPVAEPESLTHDAFAEPTPEASAQPEPFFGEAASIVQPTHAHPSEEAGTSAEEQGAPIDEEEKSFVGEGYASQLEEIAQDEEAASDHDDHIFDPGLGNLEEETMDEEEAEAYAAQSPQDEAEYDDLIEETLDVQMDSGMLSEFVRDRHIEQRTRFADENGEATADGSEIEEDYNEDEAFAAEMGEIELEDGSDSADEAEETHEPANADAARNRQGGGRSGRRGTRGPQRHAGGRGDSRMRRSTAQTTNLPAITDLLKPNQEILVQIAKEPIARKGARITSHIALPGRFLVFMPTVNHVGVSRKISSDEERQRLKHILLSEKGAASGGFIVRTAAAAASEEDLRADIRFLLTLWAEIRQRTENAKPPALIYHDLSLVERVLRDQVTDNFSSIWVDTEADYERVLRFLGRFEPALVRRVKLYTKETPLFEQFGIQEEINNALHSKVWLKSGGSIVINQTEALVAIDINTGKYVGKTARLEDTILKTNLDAIPEIVRQIRLRDLGGIIVIDFIDMDERKNRNKVMLALEDALKSDRAPSKVLQFNDFGLVAITRKRVKQSLERTLSVPCSVCSGTGMVKGPLTVCNEIYVELRKMYRQIDRGDVLLRVNPEVVKQLKLQNGRWLSEMEEMSGKTVIVKSDASLHPEQFDIQ
ncbi:MAG: Rne/Rng family ribonuclease [Acidobacteriaceae bacterium]